MPFLPRGAGTGEYGLADENQGRRTIRSGRSRNEPSCESSGRDRSARAPMDGCQPIDALCQRSSYSREKSYGCTGQGAESRTPIRDGSPEARSLPRCHCNGSGSDKALLGNPASLPAQDEQIHPAGLGRDQPSMAGRRRKRFIHLPQWIRKGVGGANEWRFGKDAGELGQCR